MNKAQGQFLTGALILGAIFWQAEPALGQISGRVKDGSGAALGGATVQVWDSYPGGTILDSGLTDGAGEFAFGAIAGDQFDLRVFRQESVGPGLIKVTHYPTVVRDLPHPITNTIVRLVAVPSLANGDAGTVFSDDASTFLSALLTPGDVVETADLAGNIWGVGLATAPLFGRWRAEGKGDDKGTSEDEGFDLDEEVRFRINALAAPANAPVWFSGAFSPQDDVRLTGATSVPGITLIGPLGAVGKAGEVALIRFEVTNTGNVTDDFTINAELDQPWAFNIYEPLSYGLSLNPGETKDLILGITIPGGTSDMDVEARLSVSSDNYGSANSGAWTILSVTTTSDAGGNGNGSLLPDQFSLAQNYPNPFNPSTRIAYNLKTGGIVRLEVINLLGQNVRTLVDGYRVQGAHNEIWDGRDDAGLGVTSGIYFYRLTQTNQSLMRKMVLLK